MDNDIENLYLMLPWTNTFLQIVDFDQVGKRSDGTTENHER